MPERNKLEIKKMKMSVSELEHTLDEMTRAEFKTLPGSVALEMFRMESTEKTLHGSGHIFSEL